MSNWEKICDDELSGGRAPRGVLPRSLYPMKIEVDEFGNYGGEKLCPFVQPKLWVSDGPFVGSAGEEAEISGFSARMAVTPGESGLGLGVWIRNVDVILGDRPDFEALENYGCPKEAGLSEIGTWFMGLDEEPRTAAMREFIRYDEWNGKDVMVLVDAALSDKQSDFGQNYVNNSIIGFRKMDDASYGIAHWRKNVLPKQLKLAKDMGLMD